MAAINEYRQIIQRILRDHASIPFSFSPVQMQTVFDENADHYLIMLLGREEGKRVHGCLAHVDIINGKFWIQRDGTEDGIAAALLEAGVPRDHIVLGFRSPELRKHTGFAVE